MEPLSPDDIRTFRKTAGYSQASLAEAMGISKRAIESWEGGAREPPAYLALLFAALNHGLEPWRPVDTAT